MSINGDQPPQADWLNKQRGEFGQHQESRTYPKSKEPEVTSGDNRTIEAPGCGEKKSSKSEIGSDQTLMGDQVR